MGLSRVSVILTVFPFLMPASRDRLRQRANPCVGPITLAGYDYLRM